jgi:hypothetical protein
MFDHYCNQLHGQEALRNSNHEAARDLRHEHPEQGQNREAVDETGGEAEQRRKRGRNRPGP